jgi:predicted PurR-regulated permease PerM
VAAGIVAAVAVLGLLYLGRAVFAPLALSLLLVALTAPLMMRIGGVVGRIPALVLTLVLTGLAVAFVGSLGLWAGRSIAGWIVGNMDRLAAAYLAVDAALSEANLRFDVLLPDTFDPRWILGPVGAVIGTIQSLGGFFILVFVFFALGLLEIGPMARRVARIESARPDLRLRAIVAGIAGRVRYNLGLWSVIGAVDATLCYVLFRFIGLDEPFAWAVLVYILNFIPFLGPLIVAILLTAFAAAQFASVWMVVVATGGTSLINFVMGSYVQPLLAGRAISISPVLLLFSVLFWAMIWGVVGAFLGVSMTIALLAACRATPSLRWIADLFMDPDPRTAPRTDPRTDLQTVPRTDSGPLSDGPSQGTGPSA